MKTLRAILFALAAVLVVAASTSALGDDGFRPIFHPPTFTIHNAQITTSFRGLDGKTQPPGVYDLEVSQGPQGILIGLLKNGKRVGEARGKFIRGMSNPPEPEKAGMADGSVKPGTKVSDDWEARNRAKLQDIHFDASSAFNGDGRGSGKISCSNNLHPGGANKGSIEFQLPAVQGAK